MSREGRLQLLRERARVLDAHEREEGDTEQCREKAPGEVERGDGARDRVVDAGPHEPDHPDDEQRSRDREREADLESREGPDPEQVDHGDEADKDRDPDLVASGRTENVRRDDASHVGLGSAREQLNRDVAHR